MMSGENAYVNKSNSGFHYGWIIVLGGFLTQVILLICLQTLPLVLPEIEKTLNIAHTAAGTIVSVFGLCYAGFSFFWGYLADKLGSRTAITVAGLIASVMVVIFGLSANTLVKAIVFYGLVGFGCAGIYSATIPKLIGAWFAPAKRGRAMSLITPGGVLTGATLGIVVPILVAGHGWRNTFVILGVIAIVIAIVFFLIIRNRPEEKGLKPLGITDEDSKQIEAKASEKREVPKNNFLEVLKLRITWHLGIMYIFWQLAYMTGTAFLAASIRAAGYNPKAAGLAITVYNLLQLVGQQIWGPLSDKWERKNVVALSCIIWAVLAACYVVTCGKAMSILYVVIAIMGIGIGNVPVLLAMFSDYYPSEIRGTGTGVISTLAIIGRFFGPLLAGMIADATHNLANAFIFAAITMFIAAIISTTLPKVKKA